MSCVSGAFLLLWVAIAHSVFAAGVAARADDAQAGKKDAGARFEVYHGLSASEPGSSAYSTLIWSPFGPVAAPGWRLRASGSWSGDEEALRVGVTNTRATKRQDEFSAGLALGYQADFRFVWLKMYAGAAYRETSVSLDNVPLRAPQADIGAAALLESWWRLGGGNWASLDASWRSFDGGVSLYARGGRDFTIAPDWPVLSAGMEAGLFKDEVNPAYEKAGPFLQARWGDYEVTLSGGLARDGDGEDWQPYAALSYGHKF
jgi:hypothetical protein